MARVGLEVVNSGDRPVWLDAGALRLDAYRNSGAQLPSGLLVRSSMPNAALYVPPRETGQIRLEYVIPADVDPDDIGSLRLRWAVAHDDGRRYVQFTDFRRIREQYTTTAGVAFYDPIWGFYDPFLYGPPYRYHSIHRYPVGRVIVRERPPRTVIRDR